MAAIRSYLETLALQQQHILCALHVDGKTIDLSRPVMLDTFSRVEAETMPLEQMPLQLLRTAMKQAAQARDHVQSAVALVLINSGPLARELWWNLARDLKQPLVTLSLVPENAYNPAKEGATFLQLRKWQLQQLGNILGDVDEACALDDPGALSNALEYRVLPWLEGLETSLDLWHVTLLAAFQTPRFGH